MRNEGELANLAYTRSVVADIWKSLLFRCHPNQETPSSQLKSIMMRLKAFYINLFSYFAASVAPNGTGHCSCQRPPTFSLLWDIRFSTYSDSFADSMTVCEKVISMNILGIGDCK